MRVIVFCFRDEEYVKWNVNVQVILSQEIIRFFSTDFFSYSVRLYFR